MPTDFAALFSVNLSWCSHPLEALFLEDEEGWTRCLVCGDYGDDEVY